ncbi:MAG TPA: crosslink repair DNA glycosylase YcaQ family protein, partial [Streptomyces sp.]
VRTILDRLADRLVSYRDERGTVLYDVPGAPFPDPGVPAPPRFLPQYDNLLLSHDDRSRVFRSDDDRARVLYSGRERRGTYLVDGFVHGTWRVDERRDGATLAVEPYGGWESAADRAAVEAEATRLLAFLTGGGGDPSRDRRDPSRTLTVDMRTGAPTAQGTVETPGPGATVSRR